MLLPEKWLPDLPTAPTTGWTPLPPKSALAKEFCVASPQAPLVGWEFGSTAHRRGWSFESESLAGSAVTG
jgi:hypothetical protein